jgi:hypothetical protein
MRSHYLEFLEGLYLSFVLALFVHGNLTCHDLLTFRTVAACSSTSRTSLPLYKINFVSIYDSFVFALDLEVIGDEM